MKRLVEHLLANPRDERLFLFGGREAGVLEAYFSKQFVFHNISDWKVVCSGTSSYLGGCAKRVDSEL